MSAVATDPRALKRERAAIRRGLISLIEERLKTRRCYWTWPWGHDYGTRRRITTHSSLGSDVSRCDACGTPCSWDSLSTLDLIRFAEGDRGSWKVDPLATEEELEPYEERWRALQ